MRGADVVQDQGDAELVLIDAAGTEVIGLGHADVQAALDRRARYLATEPRTRAWRTHPDGRFAPLPAWIAYEPNTFR